MVLDFEVGSCSDPLDQNTSALGSSFRIYLAGILFYSDKFKFKFYLGRDYDRD